MTPEAINQAMARPKQDALSKWTRERDKMTALSEFTRVWDQKISSRACGKWVEG